MLILPILFGASNHRSPRTGSYGLSLEPRTKTASIVPCPAATSTFSASHTGTIYLGVTSNLYLRVMQHKEGTWEGFTAAYGCKRLLYFEG